MSLTQEAFRRAADFFYRNTGIRLGENRREIVASRVGQRMGELGLDDVDRYLEMLHGEEATVFIETLLVGETYFYREEAHFRALEEIVVPEILRRSGSEKRSVRIWSAGCSTGCEPYTIAFVLREALPGWDVRVLATDIHRRVLEHVERGVYPARLMRRVPPRYLEEGKHFSFRDDHYHVTDPLREIVSCRRLNLAKGGYPDEMDVVFCRNVLLYFDTAMRRHVMRGLYRSLVEGGHLFIGASDVLPDHAAFFIASDCPDGVIYRKWTTDRRRSSGPSAPTPFDRRAPPAPFLAQASFRGDDLLVRCTGVIDESSGDVLDRSLGLAAGSGGASRIVLDLGRAPFATNPGLFALRKSLEKAGALGGVRFENVPARLVPWLDRIGLGRRLRVAEAAPAGRPVNGAPVEIRSEAAPTPRAAAPAPVEPPPAASPTAAAEPSAHIQEASVGGVRVLEITGDWDTERSPGLCSLLTERLQGWIHDDAPRIVVDLEGVEYMGEDVVAVLVRAMRFARERGGDVKFAAAVPALARAIGRGGMDADLLPDVEDAVRWFEKEAGVA